MLRAHVAFAIGCAACATSRPPPPRETAPLPAWATPSPSAPPHAEAPAPSVPRTTIRIDDGASGDRPSVSPARGEAHRIRSLSFRAAPAIDALRMLASIGAFTLVAPSEADGRPVTLDLRDVSVAEAVRAVLDAAQLDGVFDPAGTLRVVIRSARVGRSE